MACRLDGAKPLTERIESIKTTSNDGILLTGPLGTSFSDISMTILTFSFTKLRLKVLSAKWRPFCRGLNVLIATRVLRFSLTTPNIMRAQSEPIGIVNLFIFYMIYLFMGALTTDLYRSLYKTYDT